MIITVCRVSAWTTANKHNCLTILLKLLIKTEPKRWEMRTLPQLLLAGCFFPLLNCFHQLTSWLRRRSFSQGPTHTYPNCWHQAGGKKAPHQTLLCTCCLLSFFAPSVASGIVVPHKLNFNKDVKAIQMSLMSAYCVPQQYVEVAALWRTVFGSQAIK